MVRIIKIAKGIEMDPRKGSWALLQHKGLKHKYVMRQGGQIKLGYYTNTKGKPKVQLPTRAAPKEENHKCWKQKMWRYSTKAYHVCAVDGILEGGFVLPKQIMFVLRMVYKKLIWDTKANHVSAAGQMLECWFGVQRQIMLLP